jgi:hypothetical protein
LAIIGFTWGGWVTGSNATELVRQRVQTELVEALTPVCVDKFNRALDAPARLLKLKKVASWWVASASYAITIGQSSARSRTAGSAILVRSSFSNFNPKLAISSI